MNKICANEINLNYVLHKKKISLIVNQRKTKINKLRFYNQQSLLKCCEYLSVLYLHLAACSQYRSLSSRSRFQGPCGCFGTLKSIGPRWWSNFACQKCGPYAKNKTGRWMYSTKRTCTSTYPTTKLNLCQLDETRPIPTGRRPFLIS
jgi:hypothetical protein